LKKTIDELKPTALYDALAGELGVKVLGLMPLKSHLIVYGGLTGGVLG